MTHKAGICCLKIDVDTYDGMRDGVPRLLDELRSAGLRATFFLSFGPDNSGKAIWNVFRQRGFLKKMVRTGAPRLYGFRTVLSGTLLPARRIAASFPDLVRRIEDEGHEVGIHAWDHRLWQDHLDRLSRQEIERQLKLALDSYCSILGHAPAGVAAPAWYVTRRSLAVVDALGFLYSSDMRGGGPCHIELDGYRYRTLQIPTTRPCLEEVIGVRRPSLDLYSRAVLGARRDDGPIVLTLHAEVEGGRHVGFLRCLLAHINQAGLATCTLRELAREVLAGPEPAPTVAAELRPIHGRYAPVLAPRVPECVSSG